MLQSLIRRVVGSANDRYLKKLQKDVVAINALEPEMEALSDEELKEESQGPLETEAVSDEELPEDKRKKVKVEGVFSFAVTQLFESQTFNSVVLGSIQTIVETYSRCFVCRSRSSFRR